jgi:hypothetical protein
MARKIAVNDLRIGMYIDKLGGSWLNHPFLRSSFLLDEKKRFTQDPTVRNQRNLD